MYQLINKNGETIAIKKTNGSFVVVIPFAEDNTDYQKYLAWLAEGNEPLPADD